MLVSVVYTSLVIILWNLCQLNNLWMPFNFTSKNGILRLCHSICSLHIYYSRIQISKDFNFKAQILGQSMLAFLRSIKKLHIIIDPQGQGGKFPPKILQLVLTLNHVQFHYLFSIPRFILLFIKFFMIFNFITDKSCKICPCNLWSKSASHFLWHCLADLQTCEM